MDALVIAGSAGEGVAAGNFVYYNSTDGLWYLTDGTNAAKTNLVEIGVAQGTGTTGNAINGGVLINGIDANQSGIAAGTRYFISNTLGTIGTSAGTVSRVVAQGVTSGSVLLAPDFFYIPTASQKAAFAGNNGTPASGNTFVTQTGFQQGQEIYVADAGSTDAYAVTLSPVPAAYVNGMTVRFKANTVNTGACSLKVNTLATVNIKKNFNIDPATGDIKAGQDVEVIYDGTNFQMLSPISNLPPLKTGNTTHNLTVTGTQTIAHGLGVTPRLVRITGILSISNTQSSGSWGTYDGTITQCSYVLIDTVGTLNTSGLETDVIIKIAHTAGGGAIASASIATDATNIILTWGNNGNPDGTLAFFWEAYA
jgi:hypothetical protein